MKFVHWFDREIAQEEDPFCTLDFGFDRPEQAPETVPVNPATKRNMADQVPESVYSGQAAPDLDGTSYYILLLSGVNSRVMIRRFERGSYADLRQNLIFPDDFRFQSRGQQKKMPHRVFFSSHRKKFP